MRSIFHKLEDERILNKLFDTTQHSNKTIRLADFMTTAKLDLNVAALARLDPQADPVKLIEEFDKDLSKTANSILDIRSLIGTANQNHIVHHLKNEEKDLTKIFGESYDPVTRSLKFLGFDLKIDTNYSLEDIKELVVRSVIDLSLAEYLELKAKRTKIFIFNDAELSTEDDKVRYVSTIKGVEYFSDAIKSMRTIAADYVAARNKMSNSTRNLIDQEITFERAMIDSVVNTSTYISKIVGLEQVSRKHKDQAKNIQSLQGAIDGSSLIAAVEIDQDADLESMIDVITKLNGIKPNMSSEGKEIILKARKLGNYNANGLFMNGANILAVDLKSPSSIAHELTHAVDFNNKEIAGSRARAVMVSELRKKIDTSILHENMSTSKASYYLRDTEIIARMGEIGYLLNAFNFTPEEGIEAFVNRVNQIEMEADNPHDLRLTHSVHKYFPKFKKPIVINEEQMKVLATIEYQTLKDHDKLPKKYADGDSFDKYLTDYIGIEQSRIDKQVIRDKLLNCIYFNFGSEDSNMLMNVKNFSRAFFGVNGQEPDNINDFSHLKAPTVILGERSPSSKYQQKSVSLITSENIEFILEYNKVQKVVDPRVLLKHILTQQTHLNRTTLSYPDGKSEEQKAIVAKCIEWAKDQNDPRINKAIIESIAEIGFYDNVPHPYMAGRRQLQVAIATKSAKVLREGIQYGKPVTIEPHIKEHQVNIDWAKAQIEALEKERQDIPRSDRRAIFNNQTKLREHETSLRRYKSLAMNALVKEANEVLPDAQNHQMKMRDYWYHSTKKSKGVNSLYTFDTRSRANFTEVVKDFVMEQLSTNYKEVYNVLNANDDLLYVMSNDKVFRSKFEPETLAEMDKHLSGVIAASGVLDDVFDNNNTFYYNPDDNKDNIITKCDILNIFPLEKLGYSNALEAQLAILKGEFKQSQLLAITPDVSSQWISAQLENTKMEEEYEGYKYKEVTIDNVETIIEEAFDTSSYLNNFADNMMLFEPTKESKTIQQIAQEDEAKAKAKARLNSEKKAKEIPKEPAKPMAPKNQMSLF
ncbi:hypothetical protein OTK49_02230 [Vibrio coralliirubri]|uniref:hypothetical protein n=1 Tax=Vibrio coralliirubri TaxID=1516159 RepID=UPI0022849C06|nr:hypothetical protein [Vibrio coralliirubri]MCY9861333.1 hypothetical protein [Vibrio coralliirubri]